MLFFKEKTDIHIEFGPNRPRVWAKQHLCFIETDIEFHRNIKYFSPYLASQDSGLSLSLSRRNWN